MAKNYKLLLAAFRGRGKISSALRVDTLLGPEILYGMLSGGQELLTYITTFFHLHAIHRKPTVVPKYAEVEATTLARLLQMTLLDSQCPISMVEQTPWMEVALRRLFVILQIEESIASSASITRDVAWEAWSHIMEITPRPRLSAPITDRHAQAGVKAVFRQQETSEKIIKHKSSKKNTELLTVKSDSD